MWLQLPQSVDTGYIIQCVIAVVTVLTQAILSSMWLLLSQGVDTGYIVKCMIAVVIECWHRLYCQGCYCSCHRVLTQATLSSMWLQLSQSVVTGYIAVANRVLTQATLSSVWWQLPQSVDTGYIVKHVIADAKELLGDGQEADQNGWAVQGWQTSTVPHAGGVWWAAQIWAPGWLWYFWWPAFRWEKLDTDRNDHEGSCLVYPFQEALLFVLSQTHCTLVACDCEWVMVALPCIDCVKGYLWWNNDDDDRIYGVLFSTLERTHCAFVACDNKLVTVAFFLFSFCSVFWISTEVVYVQC